jgi:hypothetical protein
MRLVISISDVDGETHLQMLTPSATRGLEFLSKYDHEGSSIHIQAQSDNSEEAYRLLTLLQGEESA